MENVSRNKREKVVVVVERGEINARRREVVVYRP